MNAIEIIDQVRSHDADLIVENNQLVVRGRGKRLPETLHAELKLHKAELLVALGAPNEVGVLEVLADMRPYLPQALRNVPDSGLLALVNWSMLHAWNRAASQIGRGQREEAPAAVPHLDESEQGEFFREDKG